MGHLPRLRRDRPVDEREPAVERARKESGILVLRRHQRTVPLERLEVARRSEPDERPGARVTGVHDHVLVAAERDAGILDPVALRLGLDIGEQAPVDVDRPPLEPVGAARDAEVRQPGPVLDADEQQRLAVDSRRAGVEDGIDGVRPVVRR